jgi:hypothetical protein
MPRENNLSPGAALIAVVTAFIVGILASLAVRPPGAVAVQAPSATESSAREQVRWRVQSAYGVNLPVIGQTLPSVIADLEAVSASKRPRSRPDLCGLVMTRAGFLHRP